MADVLRHETFVSDGPVIAIVPAEHHGRMRTHSHDFTEIVYVADGFTLHAADGTIHLLVAGDLFYVRPGEEHSYLNAYQTKLYNLIFRASELGFMKDELIGLPGLGEMLGDGGAPASAEADGSRGADSPDPVSSEREFPEPVLPGPDERGRERILHVPMNERHGIESALRGIAEERETRRCGWESSLRVRLASFLIRYARMVEGNRFSRAAMTDDYYGYIYRILCYVDAHYAENLTMNDLSRVTGLSPDYMTRRFKTALHMTPSEYVRKFRIARAMELLSGTELSVAQVAKQTGFSDVSLFSRVFRRAVGIPPASYRKYAAEQDNSGNGKQKG